MAAEDDDALLLLIYRHLKVNGYKKAAKVLEKHVTQVETPEESSNLHDIYTGWMKLCSLAQHTKQETDDSSMLKKSSIKPEPATSEEEEEGVDTKLSNAAEEDDEDTKPPP
ncbi:ABC transporter F family member 4-like isoform X1, partial [Lates japonicus]